MKVINIVPPQINKIDSGKEVVNKREISFKDFMNKIPNNGVSTQVLKGVGSHNGVDKINGIHIAGGVEDIDKKPENVLLKQILEITVSEMLKETPLNSANTDGDDLHLSADNFGKEINSVDINKPTVDGLVNNLYSKLRKRNK